MSVSFITCHCAQLGAQILTGPLGAAAKQFSSVKTSQVSAWLFSCSQICL